MARTLMVQGTASSVGKSVLVTALCRIFRQDGHRVAPFKAQNMSLNAAVTADGLEIGRAQAVQAEAARIEPTVEMNPILLKPEDEARSQVIVLGRPRESLAARDYYARKGEFWQVVVEALEHLVGDYEIVVIEGAGSPAEVNLRATDIANMRVARHLQAPVLLVGDIDRGGVFAALVGTLELLQADERELVRGLVINKFRGDRRLLDSGLEFLEGRTGKPVLGVIPHLGRLGIADEDSIVLEEPTDASGDGLLDIAVLRLPRIANFDDFDLLAAEPSVRLRYVDSANELGDPDLVILPGTKSTIADLSFMHGRGLGDRVVGLARNGTPVLGICGGYQMLGERVADPMHVESSVEEARGLGLLPAHTTFLAEKRTRRVRVRAATGQGCFGKLRDIRVEGYEIHMGQTEADGAPLFGVAAEGEPERPDGCQSGDGLIMGTYVHGLFEHPAARQALIAWLGARKGLRLTAGNVPGREEAYERLAAEVRATVDVAAVYRLLGLDR